ncbi:hypothetical protein DCAR_0519821 [Daucus carota subsp. sativus]|uniref:Zinc finger GRF-type domain-containing protein n=1 Tax=Daucus carota subsp. sativus TaxID=79200 RepID=A0AAF1B0Y3_DAUCS|nr:hypothetical protein DCAR_0519821 [Daucus carota subsp. sativus]
MNTPPTPITHYGSNSFSGQSVKKDEHRTCFCGRRARICTSWTLKNPERRFYKCASAKKKHLCVEILRVQAEKNKLKKQLIFCLCVVAVFFFVTVVNM